MVINYYLSPNTFRIIFILFLPKPALLPLAFHIWVNYLIIQPDAQVRNIRFFLGLFLLPPPKGSPGYLYIMGPPPLPRSVTHMHLIKC